jgi:site-specific DNA-methyltransferase (adenine-specific)
MLTITNEDCMDMMARYPDRHFDLAVVDPPYGIGGDRGTNCARININCDKRWDASPPDTLYFTELFRVSENQIIWAVIIFLICL